MRALLGLLILLFSVAGPVLAQEHDAVMGEIAVSNRLDATRAAALPGVLGQALRRLTPEADVDSRIDLAAALENDPALLHRFEYEQVIRPTTSGIPSIRLMLRGWFRASAARALLVQAGVPVWPGGGVDATLWLVDDTGGERRLVDGRDGDLLKAMDTTLGGRGVRVLPAMNDLEDWRMVEALSADNTAESLAAAALRTGAEPAVLAWLKPAEAGVGAEVFVHVAGRDLRLQGEGPDASAALAAAAPALLSMLADHLLVRPDAAAQAGAGVERGAGTYTIWLVGLERAGSYVQAVELLRSQAVVTGVSPEQADGSRVRLRVQLTAPLGQLLALLAADGRLRALPEPPEDADLSLQWQP